MDYILIATLEVEKILDELSIEEREYILTHLILKLNSEKNERKKESFQKG